jgi:hypothetical protein
MHCAFSINQQLYLPTVQLTQIDDYGLRIRPLATVLVPPGNVKTSICLTLIFVISKFRTNKRRGALKKSIIST